MEFLSKLSKEQISFIKELSPEQIDVFLKHEKSNVYQEDIAFMKVFIQDHYNMPRDIGNYSSDIEKYQNKHNIPTRMIKFKELLLKYESQRFYLRYHNEKYTLFTQDEIDRDYPNIAKICEKIMPCIQKIQSNIFSLRPNDLKDMKNIFFIYDVVVEIYDSLREYMNKPQDMINLSE